jgi:hypothetical protein
MKVHFYGNLNKKFTDQKDYGAKFASALKRINRERKADNQLEADHFNLASKNGAVVMYSEEVILFMEVNEKSNDCGFVQKVGISLDPTQFIFERVLLCRDPS